MSSNEILMKEQQREQESVNEITATREASENARLHRLIEHERDVMNELREREAQQNKEMRKAKEEADLANNAKSAFLAVMSHEIRTPMTGIMGMVRLLMETKLNEQQKEYTKTLMDSGDAMMALLNDILDFEKIESGKMDLENIDFDLHRLVNGIKTLMSGHAEAKNISLKVDMDENIPRYVIGDPVRLRQVILNLTGNSIKFTDKGGVSIRLSLAKGEKAGGKDASRIRFAIQDTGVGISKEAQKNLFNPFSQADSSVSRKYGGTGLGLTISQKLIETMGGIIQIDSQEGKGSTFHFTVNMDHGSAQAIEKAEAQGADLTQSPEKSLRILIVEDNEINLKLMNELVSRMGHVTFTADSGEAGLEIAEKEELDMVLMDVELPGMSGMGTTKAIRAINDKDKAMTPVIALTGNVKDEDVRRCYASNMNGHLAKPVDPHKLKEQINKVISGKLDNPVELSEEKSDAHINMTRLDVGTEEFGVKDKKAPVKKETEKAPEKQEKSFKPLKSDTASDDDDAPLSKGPDVAPITALAKGAKEAEKPKESKAPLSLDLTEEELDEDSFESAIIMAEESEKNQNEIETNGHDVFDRIILEGLRSSVGEEKLKAIVKDMMNKADDILKAIDEASDSNNIDSIASRSHELKGMAGNFGLIEIGAIAEKVEKAAKAHKVKELQAILPGLPPARDRARTAIQGWLEA